MKYIILPLFFLWANICFSQVIEPKLGMTYFSGSVLATGCSIAFEDRYQTISMGELPVGKLVNSSDSIIRKAFFIKINNCIPLSVKRKWTDYDPGIKIKFDGIRGNTPYFFRFSGDAKGISLILRDENKKIIYPGRYHNVVYKKHNDDKILGFYLELMQNGDEVIPGKFSTTLNFSIIHE